MSPDAMRRKAFTEALSSAVVGTIREIANYPSDLDELPRLLEPRCDVVLVDLDGNPERALEIVESIFSFGSATVIACSAEANLDLAVRCMRAGAREFLTFPLNPSTLADALARIAIRGASTPPPRRTARKLFVFMGAKGGCGTTTLAANFAVALAQESGQTTLLLDLGVPLGDVAINLGIAADFSTFNALENYNRLDASFLSTLLARHYSGLNVLAAPTEFPPTQPPVEAIERLLAVARSTFDYVVVDAGARLELKDTRFFYESAMLYLVTEVGVSDLRNANRMIGQFFATRGAKLQIVVNRFAPQSLLVDEKQIEKALTRTIDWRIPDDYACARRTAISATALAMEDSPISRVIRRMARKACGLPEEEPVKQASRLLKWARRGFSPRGTIKRVQTESESPSPFMDAGLLDPDHAGS